MPNVQKLMVEEGAMATNFFMCAASMTVARTDSVMPVAISC